MGPQPQDFIKGWPHPELLNGEHLRSSLMQSLQKGVEMSHESLNYGDGANGAYMLGHPSFRKALAAFLEKQYGLPVDWQTLMSTAGSSMGTDLVCRKYGSVGDYGVVEEPTYYLAFSIMRDRGMQLLGVNMQDDGLDIEALEAHCKAHPGQIKVVYMQPVHHNPTGIITSDEKRKRLVELAREHRFVVAADEAYQLLNFEKVESKPLFYYDDPADPRVFSIGTFSKLIGPGVKVGWVQAHPSLLKPLIDVGFIDSGNNPVIFSSCNLIHFLESGACAAHIDSVSKDLGSRCDLMCRKLRDLGLEVRQPKGGYFVFVQSKGKMTGRSGECMVIAKDRFQDWMRLCFCWLPLEKLEEGLDYLKE